MNEQFKPSQIKNMLDQKEITPQQAIQMFQASNQEHLSSPIVKIHPHTLYTRDQQHYMTRMNLEENLRHYAALPIYGAVGIVDGILDGVIFGATEIAEDLSFGLTRIVYRFKDGWERGKQ